MFKIRQVHDAHSVENQAALYAVMGIYEEAFSDYPQYSAKIGELLKFSSRESFDVILLVAEGRKNRVLGFTLTFYFPQLKFGYLDYLASDPKRSQRGYGAALYEHTRDVLREAGCKGMFMDVPPDEKEKLSGHDRLQVNQRRMAFYERFGAVPVVNTKYDVVLHRANGGYPTSLVYDGLGITPQMSAATLKRVVARILEIKGGMAASDPKVKEVLASITDDPILLRAPRYQRPDARSVPEGTSLTPLHFVTTGDAHQIHHLKEKGYVERPARVQSILRGLRGMELIEHKLRHFGEKHILAVHHPSLFKFLKQAKSELELGQLVYPNVFPIRKPERVPRNWEMQAGYFCIDTFTPVTANAYTAARNAVDAAMTGATLVLKNGGPVYVLCRPPGHHAEVRAFGGFCYFNNAAIAAHHLAAYGKVAFLDLDYHHGNGSQDIFYRRDDVYFVSIHGHPRMSYPYFAGYADERGDGAGKGYNRNFPLYPGVGDEKYLDVLDQALRVLRSFRPDYLVVSLGFDIMGGDPTGAFAVTPKGMFRIGERLAAMNMPALIVQEGGYALRNLRLGAESFFAGLLKPANGYQQAGTLRAVRR